MSNKNIPNTTDPNKSKIQLTGSKKALAGIVVIAVVSLVVKKLRDQNKSVDDEYITALAKSHVEPAIDALTDTSIERATAEPVTIGKKRRLIERAVDRIFGHKK